jgi:hypothetical protein
MLPDGTISPQEQNPKSEEVRPSAETYPVIYAVIFETLMAGDIVPWHVFHSQQSVSNAGMV